MRISDEPKQKDKFHQFMWYWNPGKEPPRPIKSVNSSLRIALIGSEEIYYSLLFEGEVYILTETNWKDTIDFLRPDFILVESCWETVTSDWFLAQSVPGPSNDALKRMLAFAQKCNIPTVWWFTLDHIHHSQYEIVIDWFDYVFCADEQEIQILGDSGVFAEPLPPCVQPAIFNPFRQTNDEHHLDLGVLFDGWADIQRDHEKFQFLQNISEFTNISIMESRYFMSKRTYQTSRHYKNYIIGCVTQSSKALALKRALVRIDTDGTLSTSTAAKWSALEAAACHVPNVHFGQLIEGDMRRDVMLHEGEVRGFLLELYRMMQDDLYCQRVAHLQWRAALERHTLSHRIRRICECIGISHDWEEYPKASIIIPSRRPALWVRCLETFESQKYTNKEVVLVCNTETQPTFNDLGIDEHRDDIQVVTIPPNNFAGECLAYGYKRASGDICLRVDDDDEYGPNYTKDIMLYRRALDADVMGKTCPFRFEGEDAIFVRTQKLLTPFVIGNGKDLSDGQLLIYGNSISSRSGDDYARLYAKSAVGAADSAFRMSVPATATVLVGDKFNLLAERRQDLQTHSWQIGPEFLKRNAVQYIDFRDFFV